MTEESTTEALQRRLKEARQKTAEQEEQNRDREEQRELEKQVRLEENRARDLPHIQAAEEEHGVIAVLTTPLGAIVLKRPNHLAYRKFCRQATSKRGLTEVDAWRLVKPCIVYPEVSRVEEITEEYPGVEVKLGNMVVDLGSGDVEDVEGK